MSIKIEPSALETFRSNLCGTLLAPQDRGYEEACKTWDLTVEQHPSLVAIIANATDAIAAVNFARIQGLKITIQSTGHGIISPSDGGLLVNTSRMKGVKIDPQMRTARVEAGVLWNDVIQKAQTYQLATLSGFASNVGVVRLCIATEQFWSVSSGTRIS